MDMEVAVWGTISGLIVMVAVPLVVVSIVKLVVLIVSGFLASWATNREYADQWVKVAKLGGVGTLLTGLALFTEDQMRPATTQGTGEAVGLVLAGAALYAVIPELVRVVRLHRERKNTEDATLAVTTDNA